MSSLHNVHNVHRPHLTAREVARWLGVSLRTVNKMTASGRLTATRVFGRVRRYDPAQVEALIRKSTGNR